MSFVVVVQLMKPSSTTLAATVDTIDLVLDPITHLAYALSKEAFQNPCKLLKISDISVLKKILMYMKEIAYIFVDMSVGGGGGGGLKV